MKKILAVALIVSSLVSCNDNKSESEVVVTDSTAATKDNTDVKMSADSMKPAPTAKAITDKDVIGFVEKVSNVGMMEVELGKYAAQNAASQRVKDFGNMMVADHTKAGNELKNMATSNNITVPASLDAEQQHHVDMLKKKTGAAFDKEYMNMMVNGHKETIETFKKASGDLKEDAYKAFATMTLPVLQKHLDSAMAIKKSL